MGQVIWFTNTCCSHSQGIVSSKLIQTTDNSPGQDYPGSNNHHQPRRELRLFSLRVVSRLGAHDRSLPPPDHQSVVDALLKRSHHRPSGCPRFLFCPKTSQSWFPTFFACALCSFLYHMPIFVPTLSVFVCPIFLSSPLSIHTHMAHHLWWYNHNFQEIIPSKTSK